MGKLKQLGSNTVMNTHNLTSPHYVIIFRDFVLLPSFITFYFKLCWPKHHLYVTWKYHFAPFPTYFIDHHLTLFNHSDLFSLSFDPYSTFTLLFCLSFSNLITLFHITDLITKRHNLVTSLPRIPNTNMSENCEMTKSSW